MKSRILTPTQSAEAWRPFISDQDKHWKIGYSARALAHCWQDAEPTSSGFPENIRSVLHQLPEFKDLEVLVAIPEHQVPLPGGSAPSQNDVWVLAHTETGLVSIAVEGKVSESFGPTVAEWMVDASPGKKQRLQFLCHSLGLRSPPPEPIRYQLLHRSVSAVIEARRFHAKAALILVHSFSQTDEGLGDYQRFLGLFDASGVCNTVASLGNRSGIPMYSAWIRGDARYLEA